MQVGAGRRVWENMEHLWSIGKPAFKTLKYMTPARFWDGFNLLLELVTAMQQAAFPRLMQQKVKAIGGKIREY